MSDLRPNKSLLNNTFDGYKLAVDRLSVNSLPLISSVDRTSTNPNKFSYAYVRSHEMRNHLYLDTWSGCVYFVDSDRRINSVHFDESGTHQTLYQVFTMPQQTDVKNDSFGCSMFFPTESLCLVTDGHGAVYLLKTGKRKQSLNQEWTFLIENPLYDLLCPSFLISAKFQDNTNMLHVVTMTLKDIKLEKETSTFVNMQWLQVNISFENPNECQVKGVKAFLGKSLPNACWFNEDYTHFYTACAKQFHLVDQKTFERIEPLIPIEDNVTEKKFYRWHQCKEMVSISFDFHITESEVNCTIEHNKIAVKLTSGKTLLDGNLEKDIIPDASKWFVHKNRLEVVLIKKEEASFWSSVVPGDVKGIHDIEGEEEEKIKQVHEGLSHLTSDKEEQGPADPHLFNMQQLEECDEMADEEEVKLFSIDVFTGKVKTLKSFAGHQWLFVLQNNPNDLPRICLRHDVDGILWKPGRNETDDWEHITTFDALGYVQASKQEHKFTICSPNFKHVSITDCTSNVYVYETDTSNKKQHNQYVPALGTCEKILGCQCSEKCLYVLSETYLNIVDLP